MRLCDKVGIRQSSSGVACKIQQPHSRDFVVLAGMNARHVHTQLSGTSTKYCGGFYYLPGILNRGSVNCEYLLCVPTSIVCFRKCP